MLLYSADWLARGSARVPEHLSPCSARASLQGAPGTAESDLLHDGSGLPRVKKQNLQGCGLGLRLAHHYYSILLVEASLRPSPDSRGGS